MQVEPLRSVYQTPWRDERAFVEWKIMATRRITRPELEIMRRSVGAAGGLPRDQVERLITETDRLLVERQRMAELVDGLRGPWPELRRVLNDLHAVLHADAPTG
jgi:hypothetical protein